MLRTKDRECVFIHNAHSLKVTQELFPSSSLVRCGAPAANFSKWLRYGCSMQDGWKQLSPYLATNAPTGVAMYALIDHSHLLLHVCSDQPEMAGNSLSKQPISQAFALVKGQKSLCPATSFSKRRTSAFISLLLLIPQSWLEIYLVYCMAALEELVC